jgi:fatty acid desaturase
VNLEMNDLQRLVGAVSTLGRTRILAIAGGVAALVVALVVWGSGNGFLWSLFVGVAVVLFATTFVFGGLAFALAIRHHDDQATQWGMKSLWFLLAGIGVVLLRWAFA